MAGNAGPATSPTHGIPFSAAARVWAKVALLSFGGPAGQIAVMHRILVEEKRWISERRFLHALNYCMLLPGPEAQQLATYIGWLLHRTRGALVAGGLFILPGFLSILALSILYALHADTALVNALFFGLKAAVLAVVLHAVIRIGRRALHGTALVTLAGVAFAGIFLLALPFPLIVLGAGIVGLAGSRFFPEAFSLAGGHAASASDQTSAIGEDAASHTEASLGRSLRVAAVWLTLWFAPLALLALWLGREHVLITEGVFFSKAAVVTFGGAYSVLAYIAQQAVETHHWLLPGEMLDGLGMAETTPGPLIQVVQFVGFMGAFRSPAPFDPVVAGILGSVVTTWVTFVPCFLWILTGAPFAERLRDNEALTAGLSAITAAVVGVMLHLAIWFALHVAFAEVAEWRGFGLRLLIPDPATANPASIAITAGACVALFRLQWSVIRTLALATAVGFAWAMAFPA